MEDDMDTWSPIFVDPDSPEADPNAWEWVKGKWQVREDWFR